MILICLHVCQSDVDFHDLLELLDLLEITYTINFCYLNPALFVIIT